MINKKRWKKQKSFLKIQQDEILNLYLKEVSKIKRLTQQEIKSLLNFLNKTDRSLINFSKKYKIPIEKSIILEDNRIPEKVKTKLLILIKKREKAKEELIKSNLGLVIKIAESYKTNKMSLLDLISEGNIGLIEGIERYDVRKGAKLSTYISWWVKQKINRAIYEQAYTIRLPRYVHKILKRYKAISEKLTADIGYPARIEQIAEKSSIPINKLIEVLQYSREPLSLDLKVDDETELVDYIEDTTRTTPFEAVYYISFIEKLQQLIISLKYNEQIVINMRYGFSGTREHTLSEIGDYLGVSRERARQILKSGLANLKSAIISAELEI